MASPGEVILKQGQIAELLSQGKDREAYRIFEELPIKDQIGVYLTPVVGEAISAYEVGEFSRRAEERKELDDDLGAAGNILLAGLSGLGTLPIVGTAANIAGKVGKGLTRFARNPVDDVGTSGGGGGPLLELPDIDYIGTKETAEMTGLTSPNRRVLQQMEDKPMKLRNILSELGKKANKPGELELLRVRKPDGGIHEDLKHYISGSNDMKVTENTLVFPSHLDKYMAKNQDDALYAMPKIQKGKEITDMPSDVPVGYGNIKRADEDQYIYKVRGLDNDVTKEMGAPHFNSTDDNVIAFDSVSYDGSPGGVAEINRQQSDYQKFLRRFGSEQKRLGYPKQPFEKLPEAEVNPNKIVQGLDDLIMKRKKIVDRFNKARLRKFDNLFAPLEDGMGGTLGQEYTRLPDYEFDELYKSRSLNQEQAQVQVDLDNSLKEIDLEIFEKINEGFEGTPIRPNVDLTYDLEFSGLPLGARKLLEREDFYNPDYIESISSSKGQNFRVNFEPLDSRLARDFNRIDVIGQLNANSILDSVYDAAKKYNDEIADLNRRVFRPDPYRTKTESKTYVFPTRDTVNRLAQTTEAGTLQLTPAKTFAREGGGSSAYLQDHYKNIAKEMQKIAKELELKPESYYTIGADSAEPTYVLDLDEVRAALAKGKTIDAFKGGGEAIAKDLLNL